MKTWISFLALMAFALTSPTLKGAEVFSSYFTSGNFYNEGASALHASTVHLSVTFNNGLTTTASGFNYGDGKVVTSKHVLRPAAGVFATSITINTGPSILNPLLSVTSVSWATHPLSTAGLVVDPYDFGVVFADLQGVDTSRFSAITPTVGSIYSMSGYGDPYIFPGQHQGPAVGRGGWFNQLESPLSAYPRHDIYIMSPQAIAVYGEGFGRPGDSGGPTRDPLTGDVTGIHSFEVTRGFGDARAAFGAAWVASVPTPSSAGFLALAALVASRRRR